jgi:cell division protease FtsH
MSDKRFLAFAACVILALLAVAGVNIYQAEHAAPEAREITYTQFRDALERGQIRSVVMTGQEIEGQFGDQQFFHSYAPDDPDLINALRRKNVSIAAVAPAEATSVAGLLGAILPTLLFIGLLFLLFRQTSGRGAPGSTLGQSRARLLAHAADRVTFADVAGVDEAKESLQEIVDFLRDSDASQRLGGRIPRGVLLVGPPGTGKTLLARAIAGEAEVPFFTISGSDFVEMFVGIGASRVRAMFEQAKKSAPCIIFMDEIDAVGRRRGTGIGNANDEREQTLNQLLVEMDGFTPNQGVILIAATYRPDVLDPALLRPGRFDREVVVSTPDVVGRRQILEVHVRPVPLAEDVDLALLARTTPGFSGADLMNLVNEAALLAARREKPAVEMQDLDDAKDIVTMGAERRTHVMTDEEKRRTAVREGGRAIVALQLPAADPVHKVTIVSRGRSSGMVKQIPDEDQASITVAQMHSRIAIMMAGRAAENMVFGPAGITSATGSDVEQASELARVMVTRWGPSDALGPVDYGGEQPDLLPGQASAPQQRISEQTAQAIDAEVRKLVDAGLALANQVLADHRDQLEMLVRSLMRNETLSGDEVRDLLAGKPPARAVAGG